MKTACRIARLHRRLRFVPIGLLGVGLLGNCNPGTITTTTTTELDTVDVLQSVFRSILVEPVIAFVDERIEAAFDGLFGDNDAA